MKLCPTCNEQVFPLGANWSALASSKEELGSRLAKLQCVRNFGERIRYRLRDEFPKEEGWLVTSVGISTIVERENWYVGLMAIVLYPGGWEFEEKSKFYLSFLIQETSLRKKIHRMFDEEYAEMRNRIEADPEVTYYSDKQLRLFSVRQKMPPTPQEAEDAIVSRIHSLTNFTSIFDRIADSLRPD